MKNCKYVTAYPFPNCQVFCSILVQRIEYSNEAWKCFLTSYSVFPVSFIFSVSLFFSFYIRIHRRERCWVRHFTSQRSLCTKQEYGVHNSKTVVDNQNVFISELSQSATFAESVDVPAQHFLFFFRDTNAFYNFIRERGVVRLAIGKRGTVFAWLNPKWDHRHQLARFINSVTSEYRLNDSIVLFFVKLMISVSLRILSMYFAYMNWNLYI